MCFSPCFIAATQQAFTHKRLLQCRTCGSQAFHILDCCRNPDYVPVRTSPVSERFENWMARVGALVRAWWPESRRAPVQPTSTEALDLWEARPLVTIDVEHTESSPAFATADAAEPDICETGAVRR
jgi:hypothetical protein